MSLTPDYTTDWGLPKPKGTNLIAGSSNNLRADIRNLADKTDQSMTQVAAESADIAQTAVDVAQQTWAVAPSKRLTSDDDLNDLVEPGRYGATQTSVTSNPDLHYPLGAVHGYLSVVRLLPGTTPYVYQSWTDTWVDLTASRRLYNGSWSEWAVTPADTAQQLAAHQQALSDLTARVADIEENSTVVDRYAWSRPDAWALSENLTWSRPDGSTEVISPTYKGDGYVGTLGEVTGYSEMVITKAEGSGTIDVSCLDPSTGRHVTYRTQGEWDGQTSTMDDFQRFEEAWIGSYDSTEITKDTTIMPRSNIEWAMTLQVDGTNSWVPNHGTPTAFKARPTILTDATGNDLDLSPLQVGDRITGLNGVKLYQSIYGRHPNTGNTNWFRIDQTTTIAPDGMIQSETVWTALRDVTLGANYAPMSPITTGLVDQIHIHNGETYAVDTTAPASTWYLQIPEGRTAESAMFTSDTTGMFAAVSFLEPNVGLLRDHPQRGTSNVLRVESRDAGQLKLYMSGFESGSTIAQGTVWRFGAQWRYGETPDPSQYA